MAGIAGPFVAAFCLRDVGLSFFGLGMLNALFTAAMLISSPLWGKLVDKVGCRPILVLGISVMVPLSAVWLLIGPDSPHLAYTLLPWTQLLAGMGSAAVGIAITSMMYKVSKPRGRSVQFATYNVFVTLMAAPMPILGGWLVSRLQDAGHAVDL